MKPDASGTLTTICMLIPLVSVPYFAIQGSGPSQTAEELVFTDREPADELGEFDETGFESERSDAPPFPSDKPVLVQGVQGSLPADPFDGQTLLPDADADTGMGRAFADGVGSDLDGIGGSFGARQIGPSGQRSAQVSEEDFAPGPAEQFDAQPPKKAAPPVRRPTVAEQWDEAIAQLKGVGMRNYRVESLRDKSVYYVLAFFDDPDGGRKKIHFEGAGPNPLAALRNVIRQVAAWRNSAQ